MTTSAAIPCVLRSRWASATAAAVFPPAVGPQMTGKRVGRLTSDDIGHRPDFSLALGMERVRIGCVKYLNTLPLIEGLEKNREIELVAAVPAKLGAMLATGEVDLALASVVDFATSTVPFTLIPAGGIGCDGATLTVRLFSQVPLEQVTTLHADTDSHTSVLLARLLLKHCFGRDVSVVDFDARERVNTSAPAESSEWPQTLLLIGDKVVTDSPPAVRYPHQLDLGEQWKAWTALPFVYAVWMCRAPDAESLKTRTDRRAPRSSTPPQPAPHTVAHRPRGRRPPLAARPRDPIRHRLPAVRGRTARARRRRSVPQRMRRDVPPAQGRAAVDEPSARTTRGSALTISRATSAQTPCRRAAAHRPRAALRARSRGTPADCKGRKTHVDDRPQGGLPRGLCGLPHHRVQARDRRARTHPRRCPSCETWPR